MAVADRVRRALDAAGLQTEVREYLVHLSTPRSVKVDIVSPVAESLVVREPASPHDPDSAHPELGPAFVAYSASGTVTAPVVYVNYGLPPDYARLAAAGIDVRGKIAIARYARSHRAVKTAHRGTGRRGRHHHLFGSGRRWLRARADVARRAVARGLSVAERQRQVQLVLARRSADAGRRRPRPARRRSIRRRRRRCRRFPRSCCRGKKPSKILSKLAGPAAPSGSGFQGALPFTYRLGPGPVTVRLDVQMDASRRPIRNVIGTIAGRDPDRWIVLGTHHDAWSFGGMDPGTGLARGVRNRARPRGAGAFGLDAGALDRVRVLGCGRVRADRIDGIRRSDAGRAAREGDRLHQHRPVDARPLRRRRHAVAARLPRAGDARRAALRRRWLGVRPLARRGVAAPAGRAAPPRRGRVRGGAGGARQRRRLRRVPGFPRTADAADGVRLRRQLRPVPFQLRHAAVRRAARRSRDSAWARRSRACSASP